MVKHNNNNQPQTKETKKQTQQSINQSPSTIDRLSQTDTCQQIGGKGAVPQGKPVIVMVPPRRPTTTLVTTANYFNTTIIRPT